MNAEVDDKQQYMFLLSGEDIGFAEAEIQAVTGVQDYILDETVLVAECSLHKKRLALTRKVYKFLFSCSRKDIEKSMKAFDWKSVYKQNFSLRVHRATKEVKALSKDAKELASYIWDGVINPAVDLKNPVTIIELIVTKNKLYCGKMIYEVKESFSQRRSHQRPHNQPTSMNPKIARACVNLSGIQVGDCLVDPFCGAGGIMLEAGLMRFSTRGYDIDPDILKKCENNLDHYKVKRFKLIHLDALKMTEPADYVVTDLPYGQSSIVTGKRDKLYLDFLHLLERILKHKAVIIFPDSVDHKKLIAKTKFSIEKEFSVYVHSSLTRKIVLLKKT